MGLSRAAKKQEVENLNDTLKSSEMVVVTHYAGTNVADMTRLRNELRENGAAFKVTKNTLAKMAIKGTQFEYLDSLLSGPTGLAFSKDPVAAAKVTQKFADDHKNFAILGGGLGDKSLDMAEVEALSKLPSLDELRGKLVGLLQAPATKIAGVVQAPAGQLARVVGAYSTKTE